MAVCVYSSSREEFAHVCDDIKGDVIDTARSVCVGRRIYQRISVRDYIDFARLSLYEKGINDVTIHEKIHEVTKIYGKRDDGVYSQYSKHIYHIEHDNTEGFLFRSSIPIFFGKKIGIFDLYLQDELSEYICSLRALGVAGYRVMNYDSIEDALEQVTDVAKGQLKYYLATQEEGYQYGSRIDNYLYNKYIAREMGKGAEG